ncbi:MAG: hypothetical protein RMJ52_07885 [Gemmataceae bacterium]|nr:hypothetical protein [Gemmataceae bacterium]
MAEARCREAWAHTASMMALVANCHRDPMKTRPFTPADFDPHRRRMDAPRVKVGIGVLSPFFFELHEST